MKAKLDSFDTRILRILTTQGRMTWRDLADEIGLSLTPTLRRVRWLESEGYILGYGARLDEARLGGALEALVTVTLERQSEEALTLFEQAIGDVGEITDCYQVTGQDDYVLRVVVSDLTHYQATIMALSRIPMLARINSSFVLKTVMRRSTQVL
ncbi:MAG: Lrp/AsnC family transcriptional regulator [Sphingomonas adhaesiva]|uniref:Lrp/AsnC family transcriptional regulator n=1 Tax=Sphingomonas adhaesiva TaxID=28212 RepID=UPI002FFA51DF